jgi:hypothetical protein
MIMHHNSWWNFLYIISAYSHLIFLEYYQSLDAFWKNPGLWWLALKARSFIFQIRSNLLSEIFRCPDQFRSSITASSLKLLIFKSLFNLVTNSYLLLLSRPHIIYALRYFFYMILLVSPFYNPGLNSNVNFSIN